MLFRPELAFALAIRAVRSVSSTGFRRINIIKLLSQIFTRIHRAVFLRRANFGDTSQGDPSAVVGSWA